MSWKCENCRHFDLRTATGWGWCTAGLPRPGPKLDEADCGDDPELVGEHPGYWPLVSAAARCGHWKALPCEDAGTTADLARSPTAGASHGGETVRCDPSP